MQSVQICYFCWWSLFNSKRRLLGAFVWHRGAIHVQTNHACMAEKGKIWETKLKSPREDQSTGGMQREDQQHMPTAIFISWKRQSCRVGYMHVWEDELSRVDLSKHRHAASLTRLLLSDEQQSIGSILMIFANSYRKAISIVQHCVA